MLFVAHFVFICIYIHYSSVVFILLTKRLANEINYQVVFFAWISFSIKWNLFCTVDDDTLKIDRNIHLIDELIKVYLKKMF